jgi:hypothetical protein
MYAAGAGVAAGALLGAANRAKRAHAEKRHEKVTIDDLQKED